MTKRGKKERRSKEEKEQKKVQGKETWMSIGGYDGQFDAEMTAPHTRTRHQEHALLDTRAIATC